MPEDRIEPRGQPMYASYLTFVTLLDWLRDMEHLPSQFDRSWWGSKFSGSGGAQLMAGLRFLGLLSGDSPTARLEELAHATPEDRAPLMAALLRDAYGADLVDGLTRMTPKMLSDRINALGTTDATHRKAVAFFVNAVKGAQLSIPGSIAKQARNRPAAPVARRQKTGSTPVRRSDVERQQLPQVQLAPSPADGTIHPALAPFLADLVRVGPTWDERVYRGWKDTFDRVLLYAYPVRARGEGDEEGQ